MADRRMREKDAVIEGPVRDWEDVLLELSSGDERGDRFTGSRGVVMPARRTRSFKRRIVHSLRESLHPLAKRVHIGRDDRLISVRLDALLMIGHPLIERDPIRRKAASLAGGLKDKMRLFRAKPLKHGATLGKAREFLGAGAKEPRIAERCSLDEFAVIGAADTKRARHLGADAKDVLIPLNAARKERASTEIDKIEFGKPTKQRRTQAAMHGPIEKRAVSDEPKHSTALCAADNLGGPAEEADIIVRKNADLALIEGSASAEFFEILEELFVNSEPSIRAFSGPRGIADDADDVHVAAAFISWRRRELERFERIPRVENERNAKAEGNPTKRFIGSVQRIAVDIEPDEPPRPRSARGDEIEGGRKKRSRPAARIDDREPRIRKTMPEPQARLQELIDVSTHEPRKGRWRMDDAAGAAE